MSGRIKTLCILGCVTVATWGGLLLGPPAAVALPPTTDTIRVDFDDLSLTNVCTGEQILFSGSLLFLDHDSAAASGGSNSVSRTVLTADGLGSFGNRYHYTATSIGRGTVNSAGGFTTTTEFNSTIVSQGGDPNAIATILFVLTLTPDGQHQVNIAAVRERCRGAQ